MPKPGSLEKIGDTIIRFRTAKFGVAVYRQRFSENGEDKFSRPFYFGKTEHGKLTRFPLGIDSRSAEKLAEEIAGFLSIPTNTMAMAIAKYNPKRVSRATHVPTFAEILETFKAALPVIGRKGGSVSETTFKGYKSSLATALRKVEAYRANKPFESFFGQHHIDYSPWFDKPVSGLTAKFVTDLKLASMPPPPEGEDEPDEEEILSAKISCDTTLRCMRALFGKQAMRYFAQVGMKVPDLSEFMTEPDFGAKKYFQILPPAVIISVMRASLALKRDDEQTYLAFLLCMHCGLRRGEALAFRPSWLRHEDRHLIYVSAKGKFNPKHGHGRKAAIEPWVYKELERLGHIKDVTALDKLNDWTKLLIPKEHSVAKAVHELRKCWVSHKAKSEGILAAQQQAGHKDSKTTATHYADNLMSDRLVPLWSKPTEAAIRLFKAKAA